MKKRFTILIAVIAAILMIVQPLVLCGQKGSPDVLNIYSYASTNSWSDATQYTSATVGNVIFTAGSNDGSNTGKYYTTDNTWRFYANESQPSLLKLQMDIHFHQLLLLFLQKIMVH